MEALYQLLGISRQGFHQGRNKRLNQAQFEQELILRTELHRRDHPRMGARPLYLMMQTDSEDQALLREIGRDKFEQILLDNGLRISPIRVFHKTTYAGAFRFPNLVEGLEINQLNTVWVSDLTYYRLLHGWAYLTFILDLYSRRCLGYAISAKMDTESTVLPALKMALKTRNIDDYQHQLYFHSDGGGQYIDQAFRKLLERYKIKSSMAGIVFENPHMERFHSTAKNDYLIPWKVNSYEQLHNRLPQFVKLYNQQRPHESLKNLSPIAFEKAIQLIPLSQRTTMVFKKVT